MRTTSLVAAQSHGRFRKVGRLQSKEESGERSSPEGIKTTSAVAFGFKIQ